MLIALIGITLYLVGAVALFFTDEFLFWIARTVRHGRDASFRTRIGHALLWPKYFLRD